MQSTSNDTNLKNGWEEVDGKEITSLVKEMSGRKESVLFGKEVIQSFIIYCRAHIYTEFSKLDFSQDVLLNHLDINIVEAEKRINGPLALKEFYSVYLIETR